MKTLEVLNKLHKAYLASLKEVSKLNLEELSTYKDWEPVDALLGRFERLVDFLFQQVFRKIYILETFEQPESAKSVVLFMAKLGIIPDIKATINLKDLRNKISHEYLGMYMDDLEETLEEVYSSKSLLNLIIDNATSYLEKSR